MTTFMTTLTVFRPRGQAPEVFHDPRMDIRIPKYVGRRETFDTYSYEVLSGNVLKIYSHEALIDEHGKWELKANKEPLEIAHFRPNQWDTVRSGTPTHH